MITFFDAATILNFLSIVLLIIFAVWARCWLLVIGFLIQLPVEVQVFAFKLYRLFGIPWDTSRGAPAWLLNRILEVSSTIIVTIGLIQLLCRYRRMHRSTARELPNPEKT
jgi:uncharacterized membrane protein